MKILLDECVDRRFAGDIDGHEVKTVPDSGWAGFKNGALLERAQHEFDIFLTADRNLPFQHNLSKFSIEVVVLRSQSNRLADLRKLVPHLLTVLRSESREQVTWVGSDTSS